MRIPDQFVFSARLSMAHGAQEEMTTSHRLRIVKDCYIFSPLSARCWVTKCPWCHQSWVDTRDVFYKHSIQKAKDVQDLLMKRQKRGMLAVRTCGCSSMSLNEFLFPPSSCLSA